MQQKEFQNNEILLAFNTIYLPLVGAGAKVIRLDGLKFQTNGASILQSLENNQLPDESYLDKKVYLNRDLRTDGIKESFDIKAKINEKDRNVMRTDTLQNAIHKSDGFKSINNRNDLLEYNANSKETKDKYKTSDLRSGSFFLSLPLYDQKSRNPWTNLINLWLEAMFL